MSETIAAATPSDDRPRKPVSEKKRAANRANAKKSTGPRTPEGKARISLNALTHGLTARAAVLPGEHQDHFNKFAASLRAELRPSGFLQTLLAERIVDLAWKLRRSCEAQVNLAADLLGDHLYGDKMVREYGAYTGPFVPLTGADIVADAARGDAEKAPYLRLDLYADRLQRALLAALARLRQEQRRDAQGGDGAESFPDFYVDVEIDGGDGLKNKATADDADEEELIDLRSFLVEPSKWKAPRPSATGDTPNSENKATAVPPAAPQGPPGAAGDPSNN